MKIIWGLRAQKVTRVMNCGCLPGFPGENRKQLLNAIVHWKGLVGGDFETFQKRGCEIAKGSNKAFDRRGVGGLLPCVFGFIWGEVYNPLPPPVCSECAVKAPAVPGGCGVGLGLWAKPPWDLSL